MLLVLGSDAQFDREMMLERQREGIAKAKREGKYKGREPKGMPLPRRNELPLPLETTQRKRGRSLIRPGLFLKSRFETSTVMVRPVEQ